MKKTVIIGLLFLTHFLSAQTSINNYQYVIVPSKFSFNKQKDQYRLNTLTKLLFQKYGFIAFLDTDDMPDEVRNMNCNKLYADVQSVGSFIRTKLNIVLKDCKNKVLFTSATGESKEKEYGKSYNEALREASQSLDVLQYHYVPIANASVEKTAAPEKEKVVNNETFDDKTPILQAQPITNGFQLFDSSSKVVMKIFKTSNPSTFTAIKGTTQGVLISKDNQWFFEYYQNDTMISEKVNVKF